MDEIYAPGHPVLNSICHFVPISEKVDENCNRMTLSRHTPPKNNNTMSRKTTLIAAVLVLLLGVTAVALVQMGKEPKQNEETAGTPEREAASPTSNRFSGENPSQPARTNTKSAREIRNEELVEQYGESRTNVARHVSENVVGILDDVIEMGEAMVNGKTNWGGGEWMVRSVSRRAGIELSDEQTEQVTELYNDYRKRELQKTKDAVEQLRSDPTTLMSMVLAGDARSRGDLSEADYAELQTANAEALGDIVNPLDRNNFRGGNPMADDSFRSSLEGILDADQLETYQTKMAENEAQTEERQMTDITQMPVMDLESLDQAVGSAKQMTTGFKQMMEGMGNLQNLQPKLVPPTDGEQ